MCGFVLLNTHLRKNFPFLISINPVTEDWIVITYPGEKVKPIPQYQYIQEKLVHDFVKDWFTISDNMEINEKIWEQCSAEECKEAKQINPTTKKCALSCKCDTVVFESFVKDVLPNYRARIDQANEKWAVQNKGLLITPVAVSENSSRWQVYATVNSSVMKRNFDILIFIDVERDIDSYPATFGYYINQFNSYRITE